MWKCSVRNSVQKMKVSHNPCFYLWFQVGDLARTSCSSSAPYLLCKYAWITYRLNPVQIYFSCWCTQRLSVLGQDSEPWTTVRALNNYSLIWRFPILWEAVTCWKFCKSLLTIPIFALGMNPFPSLFPNPTSSSGDLTAVGLAAYHPPYW